MEESAKTPVIQTSEKL